MTSTTTYDRAAVLLCTAAFVAYVSLGLVANRTLNTNAFDLSVFDYALWTTASGAGLGYVPMFGYSLFAQHFMPTLLILAPLSLVFQSPEYLIVLQTLFYAVAGFLLYRFGVRHVSHSWALALTAAFLLSRRSHSAVTGYFYVESAIPMLVFGALLAWSNRRWALYWLLAVLALGCKEDVSLYFGVFGLVLVATGRDRSTGAATISVAAVWLLVALSLAIPHWRSAYGLDAANPFLAGRYGISGSLFADGSAVLSRMFSAESLGRIVTVASATGFLCLLAPLWMAVALPGIVLNLAALPGTLQAGLVSHYLWPILPWLFIAGVFGARKVPSRFARWAPLVVVLVALIDMPLPRTIARAPWKDLEPVRAALGQLPLIPPGAMIVAQPNLIPHLPRRMTMYGLGFIPERQPVGDYIMLTKVGDLWPFDAEAIDAQVTTLAADPRYEQLSAGPLYAFRRR